MGGFLSDLKAETNSDILHATCGPVRGNVYKHREKIIDGYLGIPFAEPIGRFEKPIEAKIWTEVKDCIKYGPGCPQSGIFDQMKDHLQLTFDEKHCLTLNVFSPRWKSEQFPNGFPVMVNIFGGGFEMGTSAAYDDYSVSGTLPHKKIVVVTFNYRVGALGFFTTGDDVCRGNFGLWDQTLALKWIQKHIRSFGGDSNNVTVFGCSAGGVCADLLTLSTHSRDLFHKCISMSGTADCEMACRSNRNQSSIFKEFAMANGCSGSDSKTVLKWFQEQSIDVLNQMSHFEFSSSGFMSCAPNLDGDFFCKPLEELRKEAPKKSFIFGRTEYEGLIMAVSDPVYSRIGNNIDYSSRKLFRSDVVDNPEEVLDKIKNIYSNGTENLNKDEIRKRFIEFLGDAVFNVGILNSVESATESGNDVFFYSFDYCNENGYGQLGELLDFKASTHGNDFRYVLGSGGYGDFKPNIEELEMMEFMGNPNGKQKEELGNWIKYNMVSTRNYLKIVYPNREMKNDFVSSRLEKLRKIENRKSSLKFDLFI